MNNGFDDELRRGLAPRSRRNPRLREDSSAAYSKKSLDAGAVSENGTSSRSEREKWESRQRQRSGEELNVMGDSTTHRIPRSVQSVGGSLPHADEEMNRRKRRRRMIAMIIAECFALVAIFSYGFVARTMAKIQRPIDFEIGEIPTNDLAMEAEEKMRGYWTIAIFGVDARDKAIQKNTNADVNIICNINLDTGEIRLVSVYRDSYLNISESGSYNKLNQAYADGGAEQAVAALNRNLDLQINDFITFNWKAVAQAIDILGGVDVELSKAEFYYINSFITETVKVTGIGSRHLTHAGMNHLDGVQAVAYGRLRLMDTDYARTERQRKVIKLAFEKAQKADFQTLYTLIGTVFPNVYTSLWVDDIVNNARNISKFHLTETTGFPQARGDANMGKKGACVVPATLESNVIRLHEFLFGDTSYTPSDKVKKISAKISADTGIYKEGQFIDKVGTSGGVIQPPKTTAAETTEESTESEDNDNDDELVDDESVTTMKPTRPTTLMETDEDGRSIETEGGAMRPTLPMESGGSQRPTAPESTAPSSDHSGVTDRPGGTIATTEANRPGTGINPSQGVTVERPGSGTDVPGNIPTAPTAAGTPGGSPPTSAQTMPSGMTTPNGSTPPGGNTTQSGNIAPTRPTSEIIIQQGPGISEAATVPAANDAVGAPGQ